VAIVVIAVVNVMVTYSVRFTEAAVVTTFGRADESDIVTKPGLRFRIPLVQRVTKYDTRARLVRATLETLQTADDRQIVAQTFLTWRVSNPLRFYQKFSGSGVRAADHYKQADDTLRAMLRSAMAEVSRFTLNDLLSETDGADNIETLEQAILTRLQQSGESGVDLASYGVEPLLVGVSQITLPEETTEAVFSRMKATRERLAAEAESQGASRAAAIRAEADSAASRIRAFARRRAEEIRNEGEVEAQKWIAQLGKEPDLAVFLEQLELLKTFYARRATLIIPVTAPGMSVFDPNLLTKLNGKQLPPFIASGGGAPSAPVGAGISSPMTKSEKQDAKSSSGDSSDAKGASQ